MKLLSRIPAHKRQAGTARLTQRGKTKDDDDRACYYWRLLVKQRVYKKNRDVLAQLDRAERIDKVEQTVGEVAGDYERLLRRLGQGGAGKWEGGRRPRGRRVVDDDEEEEEDEDEGDGKGEEGGGDDQEEKDDEEERPPKRRKAL